MVSSGTAAPNGSDLPDPGQVLPRLPRKLDAKMAAMVFCSLPGKVSQDSDAVP